VIILQIFRLEIISYFRSAVQSISGLENSVKLLQKLATVFQREVSETKVKARVEALFIFPLSKLEDYF
jgi:hypothetical protein